ncbi:MAG: Short-chain dehydrogenase/reductase SDR [Candidatus Woesebacteria bacterium GW2011_GWB1_45_5]|uniref:Short-chain dehydrogenase/reductase SDR n=1 Tax=Candidatus Woesebacteria bacterium GW2011_GWB1_45_5 TaxID=1618581 RepID=A0A0G1MPH4_9BACT|nr:MAG: Short-chain dehydrogenase/reductase SDR [Candidatus Woesebacteria bacterium GW2011_GWB1_45_5]
MTMDLKGKIAVITGAGGGIGSEIVKSLKSGGVRCVVIEKEKSLLEGIMDILDGDQNYIFECDFSKPADVERLGEELSAKFPAIDFLFNIAGIGIYKNIEDLAIGEWEKSININLTAPFILTKKLIPSLKKSDDAVVVNIGSGMGVIPTPGRVAYCSTKFGLRGMSLTLAEEFKGKNISFVLMTLGSVMTNFGTGGLTLRKKLEEEGKKYLDPVDIAQKIIGIIKDKDRHAEYKIYPEGYEE